MLYPLSYRGVLTCATLLERPSTRIGRKKRVNLCVLRRRMLYPLSYRGVLTCATLLERPSTRIGRKKRVNLCVLRRRMLYPLSYAGVCLYEAASIVPNFRRSVNAAQEIFRKVPQFRFSDCCNHRKLRI